MKHLSCFCNKDGCLHLNIRILHYENKVKLTVAEEFTDSEPDEAGPSSSAAKALINVVYILVELATKICNIDK
ncbi:unnamed protein product [Acanthoscelides obtectus]|uniref:Uncharacterized protein n=1 Tax=Acanthoscelides obtectus TaxID=200917 RepID=A0A9P0PET4_ACAOB|nr:unnamed protein product [Acanthoscelides obtectus]CAK1670217.1 hypothetical protein AOBTE_LOCUS27484 [Acanthoscelides obtectus]